MIEDNIVKVAKSSKKELTELTLLDNNSLILEIGKMLKKEKLTKCLDQMSFIVLEELEGYDEAMYELEDYAMEEAYKYACAVEYACKITEKYISSLQVDFLKFLELLRLEILKENNLISKGLYEDELFTNIKVDFVDKGLSGSYPMILDEEMLQTLEIFKEVVHFAELKEF